MKKLPNEEIFEFWMPRLSGSGFKVLFTVLTLLDRYKVEEVKIRYQEFIDKTGMSRNTVIAAVSENKNLLLLDYREDAGKFFYRKGSKIAPVQNLNPSKNSTGLKIAPRRIEDRIFWHWGNLFYPGEKIVFDDARRRQLARILDEMKREPQIAANPLRELIVYKKILQALRGYYRMGGLTDFMKIFASRKTVDHGAFRYFSWRTK
jgi:hypothetical protein